MKEIMDAVTDTFSIFGPNTSKVLMFHLENQFGLKPEDIPNRPQDFHAILQQLFGNYAASLELAICKQIRSSDRSHSSEFVRFLENNALQEVKVA
jgi:hypothetical protein